MFLLDLFFCIVIFLIGFNLKYTFSDFTRSDYKFLNQIFFFHFFIAILFHLYISNYGGDANFYWSFPKTSSFSDILILIKNKSASGVIYLINYIPSKVIGLSFFTGNMLYALLGYFGFIYLYRITKILFKERSVFSEIKLFGVSVFPWIWFLPNLHFWSSGIGKDTILFFCIAIFVYSLCSPKKHWFLITISLLFSLLIRPHITLFLLVSFGLGYILDNKLKRYKKALVFLVFGLGLISIFSYVIEFIQLESFETKAIEEYTSRKSSKLNQIASGSGVDVSTYPIPAKIATFLFRPFFFDINAILAIIASVENLILLLFSIIVFKNKPYVAFKKGSFLIKGIFIYFIIASIAFSLVLGNLGIMLRQKNMVIPMLIIFGLWVLYYNKSNKIKIQ